MATVNKEKTVEEKTVEEDAASILGAIIVTEVVEKEDKALAIVGASVFDDFDNDIVATSDDFKVPTLKLMQGSSDAVKERQANLGEYRNSLNELLADENVNLEVIIFKREKYWSENEIDARGKKIKGTWKRRDFTLNNSTDSWQWEDEDGKTYTRAVTFNYYLILANPEGEQAFNQIPMIFSLSRSSMKAAKDINLILQELKIKGKLPVSTVIKLGRRLEKNKDGDTFFVPTASQGRTSTKSEMEAAAFWRSELATKQVVVDGEES